MFLSDEGGAGISRILNDSNAGPSPLSNRSGSSSKNKVPKELHFGDLIEKNFGMSSFDLKREMEILRKVDEEIVTVKFKQKHTNEDQVESPTMFEEVKDINPVEEVAVASATDVKTDSVVKNSSKSQKMELEYQRLKALVTIPYLPTLRQLDDKPIYTLVLDLDETLIHLECDEEEEEGDENNEDSVYYLIRPGAIRFLNELSKYFEIVIFTAAMPDVRNLS